jgi:YD repeat-containing protein
VVALGEGSTTTATTSNMVDADRNVAQSVDADGQAINYTYNNNSDQETGETWYPTLQS